MDVQAQCSSIICFPLESGAMLSALILFSASFGLAIWGMVNAAPITIIYFLIKTTTWFYYLLGIYKSKLTFMWPALLSAAVSIIGLYVVLTFICFSAFLTENHVAVMDFENGFFLNLSKKEHFVTLFIGSVVQVCLIYLCYISFCAYEKIRMEHEQLQNIRYETQNETDIERDSGMNDRTVQSYDL